MPTLLFQLRDAARVERDHLIQFNLKLAATELSDAIDAFTKSPSQEHLQVVNGKWAHGVRTLGFASGPAGGADGRGAGLKEGALLANVA